MNYELLINVITVVVCVIGVIALWYNGKKKLVLQVIEYLVENAEKTFGSGTGELKYDFVTSKIYSVLPSIVRIFATPKAIDTWIEAAVEKLQLELAQEITKYD